MLLLAIILITIIYITCLTIKDIKLIKNLTWLTLIIALALVFLRFFHPILAFLTLISIIPLTSLNKIINLMLHFEVIRRIYKNRTKDPSKENLNIIEAAEILNIKPDATEEEINTAFRKLIKKHHPDHGGSAYFADKLTKARELLLQRRKK